MIPHNRLTLGVEESEAAKRAIESGWLAQGREVQAFENEFCAFLGLPDGHAVTVSSGAAALFLALWVLDAAGCGVGCPVYGCSALTNAIALVGGRPILLDTERNSPNIDLDALLRCDANIVIVPHMFGLPVDLRTVAGKRVVEDCAQALGAKLGEKPVGLLGVISIFSFYATKLITSGGQGGMLVSTDRAVAEAARDYREFDCRRDRKPRFNFQMTDLQAAIGRAQLRKLPSFLSRRREIFEQYRQAGLDLVDDNAASPVRYRSIVRSKHPRSLIDELRRRDVEAIVPVEDWELLGPAQHYPAALAFARTTVSLPTYPSLSDADMRRFQASVEMILSIHQPAYLPWLGYFDRIARGDKFVYLDNVQFERNSFINRNRIKTSNGPTWLTIPVRLEDHFNKTIADIEIDAQQDWKRKHLRSIEQNYRRAPDFTKKFDRLAAIYDADVPRLSDFCFSHLLFWLRELEIATPIVRASALPVVGNKSELILNLCRHLGAATYLSGSLGRDYLRVEEFSAAGVQVCFHEYVHPQYPQMHGSFTPAMGIVDYWMNCSEPTMFKARTR